MNKAVRDTDLRDAALVYSPEFQREGMRANTAVFVIYGRGAPGPYITAANFVPITSSSTMMVTTVYANQPVATHEYNPTLVAELLRLQKAAPEKEFSDSAKMMEWLNRD